MYEAKFTSGTLEIVFCALVVLILNSILSGVVGKIQGYDVAKIATLKNCVMFNNVGNMGSPLLSFVFTNVPYVIDGATPYADLGLVSVVSIMIIQTITAVIPMVSIKLVQDDWSTKDALNVVFHMPMVAAIPLALFCQLLPF